MSAIAYDLQSAAEAVPFSVDHLRRAIRSGALKAKKDGRKYVIPAKSLEDWIDRMTDADASN